MTGARVVPCITRQLPGAGGYVTRFYPAWQDFPGASVEDDTRRMNAFIEDRAREMPSNITGCTSASRRAARRAGFY